MNTRKQFLIFIFILQFIACNRVFCNSVKPSTVRFDASGNLANIYFSSPVGLKFKAATILSNAHFELLHAVGKLSAEDQYQVNHLFAQLFCIVSDAEHPERIFHANICWDEKVHKLSLCPDVNASLANFVSREYKEGVGAVDDTHFCYRNPTSCTDLALPHSEHILVSHLEKNKDAITNFFRLNSLGANLKIQKMGVILYSSLDSCDICQEKLVNFFRITSAFSQNIRAQMVEKGCQMAENLLWTICFFSAVPCKKSSYVSVCMDARAPFIYDKEKRRFFFKDRPFCELSFPCSIPIIDISQPVERQTLLSHIEENW